MATESPRPPLPSLEGPIDLADHQLVDSLVKQQVEALLAAPALHATLMPAGRHAWFVGFLQRSLKDALLRPSRHDLDDYWRIFQSELIERGVVPTVLDILRLANDADDKEQRRGQALWAEETAAVLLHDKADVRTVLESAIGVGDTAVWQRYPAWYGRLDFDDTPPAHIVTWRRAQAVRFLPVLQTCDGLLWSMLDDPVREVRHVAAVRVSMLAPDATDERLLLRLLDAATDRSWVWSWRQRYDDDGMGYHEALLLLERFGARASAAVPLLKAEIAATTETYRHGWAVKAHHVLGALEGDPSKL